MSVAFRIRRQPDGPHYGAARGVRFGLGHMINVRCRQTLRILCRRYGRTCEPLRALQSVELDLNKGIECRKVNGVGRFYRQSQL